MMRNMNQIDKTVVNADIEVFFDPICPWCFIGFHRLEQALKLREAFNPVFKFKSFQLNPTMPLNGMERNAYLSQKFGSYNLYLHAYRPVLEAASEAGLSLNLDSISVTPSTFNAHLLNYIIQIAIGESESVEFVKKLYQAYFIEGKNIGESEVLIHLADQIGIDPMTSREILAYPQTSSSRVENIWMQAASAVKADQNIAAHYNIQGAPFMIFDHKYALSGAQPSKAILPILDLILKAGRE